MQQRKIQHTTDATKKYAIKKDAIKKDATKKDATKKNTTNKMQQKRYNKERCNEKNAMHKTYTNLQRVPLSSGSTPHIIFCIMPLSDRTRPWLDLDYFST